MFHDWKVYFSYIHCISCFFIQDFSNIICDIFDIYNIFQILSAQRFKSQEYINRASPMTQQVKNLPAIQETQEMWVQFLGLEDPLEKDMATHSVLLPGESHGLRSLAGYSPMGHKELGITEWLRSKRQRRKGKMYTSECRVPKNRSFLSEQSTHTGT